MIIPALLFIAFVCFVLASFWQPSPPRVNLIAAGLASWVLAELLVHTGFLHQ